MPQPARPTDGEDRGRDAGRPVEVNPFWSDKARAEAELQAHRPRDLPRVPETSEGKGTLHELLNTMGSQAWPREGVMGKGKEAMEVLDHRR